MSEVLTIVKIGGQVIESAEMLPAFLSSFALLPAPGILIHGGGKRASDMSRALGIEPQMIDGRRVTDAATLDIVTMVYAGLINKQVVARLQALGVDAIGFSGADANLIRAKRRTSGSIDYGFVGDVTSVNSTFLCECLSQQLCPVISPITHDGAGQLLNTNADSIASAVAVAMAKHFRVRLLFGFEKPGVLLIPDDERSVIPRIDRAYYHHLRSEGVITAGMLPKLDNAFNAIEQGVAEVVLGDQYTLFDGRGTVVHA
jgi:acetylglutamate kinase